MELFDHYETQPEMHPKTGQYSVRCPVCKVVIDGVYVFAALGERLLEHMNAEHSETGH